MIYYLCSDIDLLVMSALGIWNNRYEGGPCYADCMETFTLYFCPHPATTPPSPSAGRDATTALAASTRNRADRRRAVCASASPPSQWVHRLGSLNELLTSECTPKCSQYNPTTSTVPAWLESDARDTDLHIYAITIPTMSIGLN